jgi:hypothetical protein
MEPEVGGPQLEIKKMNCSSYFIQKKRKNNFN